jgi:hypothetical protein
MRLIAAILLAGAAMIRSAEAQNYNTMDAYSDCWSSVSVGHLNQAGVSAGTLDAAAKKADQICAPHKDAAARDAGTDAAQEMRSYMEVAMHRANPVDETRTAAVKPRIYQPVNPKAIFNTTAAYLCAYPSDVDKFTSLLAAGEKQAALGIGDDLIQVTYVRGDKTFDLWTRKALFNDRRGWMLRDCQMGGTDFSTCLTRTRDQ